MIRWYGADFMGMVHSELVKKFTRAGVSFVSATRGYLNTSQSYTRTPSGKHIGLAPSLPGQFPKKLSGQLQRSVTWSLDQKKMVLTVGSNLAGYPQMLQTGTRLMQPRPWLTLSFARERDKLGKLIVGK